MILQDSTESNWFIFGTMELSWEERIKQAQKKVRAMTKKERRELAKQCFGMWKDYPEDWLEKMREGKLNG